MLQTNTPFRVALLTATAAALSTSIPAWAQTAAPTPATDTPAQVIAEETTGAGDIIVTARKRDERLLDVPIAVTALGGAALSRSAATDLTKIGQLVPQASFEKIGGGGNGATFTIRGIGSASGDKGIEQSVAVNIDGVQSSRGKISILSFFDIQQVEVLKGPQPLFFGKNSTGGVISVKSVNPGDELSGYVRGGYEFKANERYVEGAISIPLTDTLKIRLAARGNDMDGWVKNQVIGGAPNPLNPGQPIVATHDRYPGSKSYLGRFTAVWEPSSDFSANLKLFAAHVNDNSEIGAVEVKCAPGVTRPTSGGISDPTGDCKANGRSSVGTITPEQASHYTGARNGQPYSETTAVLGSLTLAYKGDNVSVTSITGGYYLNNPSFDNYDSTSFVGNSGANPEKTSAVSQELRVASDFDSPINFTIGAYFESQKRNSGGSGALGSLMPDSRNGLINSYTRTDLAHTETYSAFGQLSWEITDKLNLTGGARYTKENKDLTIGNAFVNQDQLVRFILVPEGVFTTVKRSDDNISPEVTLTYKPERDLMFYGTYKTGFKSGGLSSASVYTTASVAAGLSFKPEKAKGGEIGAKGQFLDNKLTITAAAYRYNFKNLQSTSFDASTISFKIKNAGQARTTGAEINAQYQATRALSLNGAVGYNRARFTSFVGADCYGGQTAAEGCIGGIQDLSGTQLTYAPTMSARGGFVLDQPLTGDLNLDLNGDAVYTSSYWTNSTEGPLARQNGFWKVNAGVSVRERDDRWELALIGRNLTNKYYAIYTPDKPSGVPGSEVSFFEGRPREIILQGTFRF